MTRMGLCPSTPLNCDKIRCDCLEDKKEDNQKSSVLYCIPQLYTVISTHMSSSYRCTRACWFRFSLVNLGFYVVLCFSHLGPVCVFGVFSIFLFFFVLS